MKQILINPFENYSEKTLFAIGIVAFFLVAVYTNYTNLIFLGSLKVIYASQKPLYYSIANLGMTILFNTALLYVYAIIRNTKTRFIDVLNTVLIAHIAMYVLALITGLQFVTNFLKSFEFLVLDHIEEPTGMPILPLVYMMLFALIALALLVYFFVLIIKGMKIATNRKQIGDTIIIIVLVVLLNSVIQFINPYM